MNIGIIGYGYWGPTVARNFSATKGVKIVSICDLHHSALEKAKSVYPHVQSTTNYREITTSKHIDAVAIVTQVFAHYEIAKSALENGKDVFIEKPFTATVEQAKHLLDLANQKNLVIMVDHVVLFTSTVKKIKQLIDHNELGKLYYYDATRINLGLFQPDVNVVWDLAPHDLSIIDYLVKTKPVALSAHGKDHFSQNLENIAYVTIYYEDNLIAHFNFNWLSPVKVRTTLIGGEKKMLIWNDLEPDDKIKIYDKGINVLTKDDYEKQVSYRLGDMYCPKLETYNALKQETEYFVDCMSNRTKPLNDGESGLRIVEILELCNKSLKNRGMTIEF